MTPTQETYRALQTAYDHYNKRLFGDGLPALLITLQRSNKRVRAHYSANRFNDESGAKTDELAMNPMHFRGRTTEEVLSTLVHEMVHVWQGHFGKPGRRGYHNREWAAKMKTLGLHPSDTGEPGGDETGESMTHFVKSSGPFSKATTALIRKGFALTWAEPMPGKNRQKSAGKSAATRTRFSCPQCDLNAWAKPTAKLKCGDCEAVLAPD